MPSFRRLFPGFVCLLFPLVLIAQEQPAPPASGPDTATQAVAAQAVQNSTPPATQEDLVDRVVDQVLALFDVRVANKSTTRYLIAGLFIVVAILLRRVVTFLVFNRLRKFAAKTTTSLDDKIFPAVEGPCSTAIVLFGFFAALRVLKLPAATELSVGYASTIAFSLVIFWGLLRTLSVLLDHAHEIARFRQLGIAAFMPWIKKTSIAVYLVIGSLIVIQSLGYDVRTLLAGLGLGGLAFALAAQDTLANLFGSVVVAIDQPFKIGEYVSIGSNEGTVEDIGLRSTRLRTLAKNVIILPNKFVASEAITNNSRFIQRRVELVIGLTYSTTPDKMEAIVATIRTLITDEPGVDPASVHVYFRDFNDSSLDIWVVYNVKDPDFPKHMVLRQRLNLAIMRAVQAAGLDFAFPSRTLYLDGDVAKQIAAPRTN